MLGNKVISASKSVSFDLNKKTDTRHDSTNYRAIYKLLRTYKKL